MAGGLFSAMFGAMGASEQANWDKYNQQMQLKQYVCIKHQLITLTCAYTCDISQAD